MSSLLAFLCVIVALFHCTIAEISEVPKNMPERPPFWKKAETARWLAHSNVWGTLSTISVHLNGQAWGQPKSFVDGTRDNSTGNFYFYDSEMDASMQVNCQSDMLAMKQFVGILL